ncbi:hypothetical protein GGR56DRAFT_670093 [Xylariaceae sp. FL0804]|nr:hypothetical protein GGR56DRAFT_670093 [Xylariaceae sp. FL0804]
MAAGTEARNPSEPARCAWLSIKHYEVTRCTYFALLLGILGCPPSRFVAGEENASGTKTETETEIITTTNPGRDDGGSNDDDGGSNNDVGNDDGGNDNDEGSTLTKITVPGHDCGSNDGSSGNDDNEVNDNVADNNDDRGDKFKFQ